MIDNAKLQMLESQGFKKVYENSFMQIERIRPFDTKRIPYRFSWVAKHLPEERGYALDVGCGNGLLAHVLQSKGFKVAGVDISETAIETARKNVPEVVFSQMELGGAQQIGYPTGNFDVVTCCEVIEHVADLNGFLSEIVRILKPGGKLIITTPVEKNYDCVEHIRYFDFYTLADAFEPFNPTELKICCIYKDNENEEARGLFGVEVTF